jgi:hypothetical protein
VLPSRCRGALSWGPKARPQLTKRSSSESCEQRGRVDLGPLLRLKHLSVCRRTASPALAQAFLSSYLFQWRQQGGSARLQERTPLVPAVRGGRWRGRSSRCGCRQRGCMDSSRRRRRAIQLCNGRAVINGALACSTAAGEG